MRSSQPSRLQAGGGQHDGVVLPFVELAQARVQVAAHGFDRAGPAAAARSCAARRSELVPTFAPCGQFGERACPPGRRAGLRAAGTAASTRPAGSSVGRSFRLCTARSARPSSSASSISLVNRPLVPTLASGTSVILSPVVLMISMRRLAPSAASRGFDPAGLPQGELRTAGCR